MERGVVAQPRVALAIDFSEGAAIATVEAKRIASQLGAALVALHVVPGPRVEPWRLDQGCASWMARSRLEPAFLVLRFGVPWVELVRYAKEARPLVMVAGSHGVSGFNPLALGSTVGRLCLVSAVPLMVVSPATLRWSAPELAIERRNEAWDWSEETNDTQSGGST